MTLPNVTATMMRDALRRHFDAGEWALAFEVGDGTGQNGHRHADAVAMNLWPSRGLTIEGIEIKVSRSDWQRELAVPEKADRIARHCDRWWLAAAPGVVKDINEVPAAWGVLLWNEKRAADDKPALKVARQAPRQEAPEHINRTFVAALVRAFGRPDQDVFAAQLKRELRNVEIRVTERVRNDRLSREIGAAKQLELLTATLKGHDLSWLADEQVCQAVALVLKAGVGGTYCKIANAITAMENLSNQFDHFKTGAKAALANIGLPTSNDPEMYETVAAFRNRAK